MPLASLFATPVAMYEYPGNEALNQELTALLTAESKTVPSIKHSNVGSWHSQYDLQKRPEACFRTLNDMVLQRAQETSATIAKSLGCKLPTTRATTHMWAMVMYDGHYTIPHTHADSHWATVYYPDVGDGDNANHPDSGVIAFTDPRSGVMPLPGLDMTGGEFLVSPKAGQLLVFPGWLTHYVHVYRGTRPRISIACNVTYQPA